MESLNSNEIRALELLREHGGSILESKPPETNERDVFGCTAPGLRVYRRLARKGLVFFTEELPCDWPSHPMDGFQFTPEIVISETGLAVLAQLRV